MLVVFTVDNVNLIKRLKTLLAVYFENRFAQLVGNSLGPPMGKAGQPLLIWIGRADGCAADRLSRVRIDDRDQNVLI
jgi:hypothetical protein